MMIRGSINGYLNLYELWRFVSRSQAYVLPLACLINIMNMRFWVRNKSLKHRRTLFPPVGAKT